MVRKIVKTVSAIIFMAFLLCLLTLFAFAKGIEAPGGNVTGVNELIEALGGEEAAELFGEKILLKDDITLCGTANILSGSYCIEGGDCTVTKGFSDGDMFFVSGAASLTFGSENGENRSGTLTLVGAKDDAGNLINIKGSLTVYYGTVIETSSKNAIVCDGNAVIYGLYVAKAPCPIYNTGIMTLIQCEFYDCTSESGGAVVNTGIMSASECKFSGCSAKNGGAILNDGTAIISICEFENCMAKENGGAVLNRGEYTDKGGKYSKCSAYCGGAISNSGKAYFSGNFISECTAEKNGGFANNYGVLELTVGGYIDACAAKEKGGGVFNAKEGRFSFDGPMISSNTAEYGGGVFNLGFFEHLSGCITMNEADVGSGVLNAGTLSYKGSPVVESSNDVFILLTDNGDHAISVDSAITAPETATLSCGTERNGKFQKTFSNGAILLKGEFVSEKHGAFKIEGEKGSVGSDGRLTGVIPYALIAAVISALILIIIFTSIILIRRKMKKNMEKKTL